MEVTSYAWIITVAVMITVLAIDVFIIGRRPHEPSMRECSIFIGVYVTLAVLFGFGVWAMAGPRYAGEFFAGWLTEYSLSIDNLFIFIIIMSKMKVPRHLQQFALIIGIVLALIFRGIFIALGAVAIERFSWVFFLFGAFLIWTAVKLALEFFAGEEEEDATAENRLMRVIKKRVAATDQFHGTRLTWRENGRKVLTPMFFVIVALGTTDLLFALDSIPAIYGLTQEPYLVFTANVFALMGLRQLYFLIGGLLKKLVYLSLGLSVILVFIGVKLVLHAIHEYNLDQALGFNGEIPIVVSLLIIVGTLVITTVTSLVKSKRDEQAKESALANPHDLR